MKRLRLHRESLRVLNDEEQNLVVGGRPPTNQCTYTLIMTCEPHDPGDGGNSNTLTYLAGCNPCTCNSDNGTSGSSSG